ncbi:ATP-binding protein [Leptospira congkakensis]|uniref:ATP-binding protein n=1 Tax=Leptospira congkakensis TaxID=2484932 RepID=A0A4Z1AIK3_9LEPT|nr:DUF6272 family protein [Leptospira congkakensis]TGL88604.1 ATP-binding protein [Leptospira congkakensis]TGL89190.1 ATP-binding protein [Leptospira congkakensis]TGL97158.1 ATP-binding protein [Leptospira congkakensis]
MSFASFSNQRSTITEKTNEPILSEENRNHKLTIVSEDKSLLEGNSFYHSHLSISLSAIDMTFYWKRCDVLSNFISQFYFHSYESKRLDNNAISTIINELVENAAKYSDKENSKIFVEIKDLGTHLRVEVKNRVTPWTKTIFENKIQTIQSGNIDQLYFEALETRNHGTGTTGIGLLMLLKDYQLNLAYEFTKVDEFSFEVTIRVHIPTIT